MPMPSDPDSSAMEPITHRIHDSGTQLQSPTRPLPLLDPTSKDAASSAVPELPRKSTKKRVRKPRGRGLRTKTGCLTCRKRHKKCDERLPICSHCATSSRECVWPDINSTDPASATTSQQQQKQQQQSDSPGSVDGNSQPDRPTTSHSTSLPPLPAYLASAASLSHLKRRSGSLSQDDDPPGSHPSAATSSRHSSPSARRAFSPELAGSRPNLPPPGPVAPTLDYNFPNGPIPDSHNIVDPALAALYPDMKPKPRIPDPFPGHMPKPSASASTSSPRVADLAIDTNPHSQHSPVYAETVTSDGMLSAGIASTRWLDLLAGDAAEADSDFTLSRRSSRAQHFPSSLTEGLGRPSPDGMGPGASRSGLRISNSLCGVMGKLDWELPERYPWQEATDIELRPNEAALFRGFAERSALWLDVFDPYRHFSTYAIRLAMRNVGLMKAILALQALYASIAQQMTASQDLGPGSQRRKMSIATIVDPTDAVQYYHEALHYVSTALQHSTYAHSEELLGTALVISTYEMLDAHRYAVPQERSSVVSNWQRHLKGVFWIQRSQDVNGASGGLRQSVWWAWLRQDLWAAFREGRRCLSFWRPVVDYPSLTQCELADRAVYLLSQAVNYCAKSGPEMDASHPELVMRRAERGEELMGMLERWRSFLGDGFQPLPTGTKASWPPVVGSDSGSSPLWTSSAAPFHGWQPIWIHPPQFAVAMQLYSFAKILVALNRPEVGLFDAQIKTTILSESVSTICGIAMELKDQGCQIMSAQCLFGAGLCVQTEDQQEAIIGLIKACEARSGWPMATMRSDLRSQWLRGDAEMKDA